MILLVFKTDAKLYQSQRLCFFYVKQQCTIECFRFLMGAIFQGVLFLQSVTFGMLCIFFCPMASINLAKPDAVMNCNVCFVKHFRGIGRQRAVDMKPGQHTDRMLMSLIRFQLMAMQSRCDAISENTPTNFTLLTKRPLIPHNFIDECGEQTWPCLINTAYTVMGNQRIVQAKINILSSFTRPHVVGHLCDFWENIKEEFLNIVLANHFHAVNNEAFRLQKVNKSIIIASLKYHKYSPYVQCTIFQI